MSISWILQLIVVALVFLLLSVWVKDRLRRQPGDQTPVYRVVNQEGFLPDIKELLLPEAVGVLYADRNLYLLATSLSESHLEETLLATGLLKKESLKIYKRLQPEQMKQNGK